MQVHKIKYKETAESYFIIIIIYLDSVIKQ